MTGKKSKAAFILFITAAFMILAKGGVLAKEPQFRLDIDSLNMEKGVSSSLVISLVNARGAEVKEIKGLENFNVLSSRQSASTRIINGDTSFQTDIYHIIMPKDTGNFVLKGIVEYNGVTHETNELKINVEKANAVERGEAEDLFVEAHVSNEDIYFGQKVALVYELYSRYNIENFGFLDDFNIDGFIISHVPEDKLKANYVYLEGNKYVKYEAKQMYLSPIKTGTITIPAYNFQANVSTGDFFNSSKPVYLQTQPKEITVKPLPLANQPVDFSGLVGILNLEAGYSKQEVEYGDSLTLRVKASGNCNLEVLEKIIKDGIPGFSVYETEKDIEESIENGQYKAQKEFEVILVPEKNGDIKIEPAYISYFNPESGSYEKAEIPGTTIKVKGEIPQVQNRVQDAIPPVETVKIEQVSYKTKDEEYLTIQFKKDILLILLVAFIVVFLIAVPVILFFLFKKKHDKKLQDIYRQLKNAGNKNEIYNLLNSMIKYRFNLSLKASSRHTIINRLTAPGLANPVLEIMDYMENGKNSHDKGHMYLKDKIKAIYKMIK